MKTIEYIKKNGIASLKDALGISVREYPDHRLMVLNYSQIDSPKLDPIVSECRGLILHMDTLEVVSRSFDRFFNYGENNVGIGESLHGCEIYEKCDGSLIKIYHHNGRWEISTRGTAFAETDCNGFGDFRSLVLSALRGGEGCTESEFQEDANFYLNRDMTYIYEFTSPENRVVTPYSVRGMTLLATRHNESGRYGGPSDDQDGCFFAQCGKAVKHEFSTMDELIGASKTLTGLKEGFVVYKDSVPWFKCKSPMYVTAHHIRGEGLTHNRIIALVLSGEVDEYLTYFQDDAKIILPYKEALESLIAEIRAVMDDASGIVDQKEFALKVKHHKFASCLFSAKRNGTCAVAEFHNAKDSLKFNILDQSFKELVK